MNAKSPAIALPHSLQAALVDDLPRDLPTRPVLQGSWWKRLLGFLLRFVLLLVIFASVVVLAQAVPERAFLPGYIAVVCLGYAVMVTLERRRRVFELSPRRMGGLGWGLLIGASAQVICVLAIIAVLLATRTGSVAFSFGHITDWGAFGSMLLFVGVAAAVCEELLLRGFLYRLLEEHLGTWAAVVVTALVFGFLHMTNPGATTWSSIAIALEAGVSFALLFALTRSLWVVIGMHFAWNVLMGPVLGMAVSGVGRQQSAVQVKVTGPTWVTGGAFGTEASAIAVVIMTAFGVYLGWEVVRRNLVVARIWVRERRARARSSTLNHDGS